VVLNEGDDVEALKTAPNGTGAFTFTNWVQGDSITMTRNDAYWGEAAKLETVTIKYISDPTAAFNAVMAGDVDAFPTFPAPENLPQFDADPRFTVIVGSTEGETILSTNNKMPPFDNPKVREALSHAIDRNAIIQAMKHDKKSANRVVRFALPIKVGDVRVGVVAPDWETWLLNMNEKE